MKVKLATVRLDTFTYPVLEFICPGCAEMFDSDGLHLLPVNSDVVESWEWDGDLDSPTISPSILTRTSDHGICHSFVRGGVFEYLEDCSHSLASQRVPMPDLPDWVVDRGDDHGTR